MERGEQKRSDGRSVIISDDSVPRQAISRAATRGLHELKLMLRDERAEA